MAKKSYIEVVKMLVEVEVLEHKTSYGRNRCVIKPVAGKGQTTISADKVIVK